ncbi:YtxH domain-containing protein [Streptomyces sp. WMMC500]|uniref:YtxH domain-containing protein n=1 Tax=Streptomyces sp. WMMC500 TaxID=3015154 RepID=UPI00248CC3D3|nr:YtxH domain-containing protein [Streptomyces sp. WMMC500]WBB59496.1 YtxH domain-containing protein [Streptomyces sp. WMMC500]
MRYRVSFVAGIAVGYVLGSRAGRERYEQMRKAAQQFSESPAVRNAAEAAALTSRDAVTKAASSLSTKFADVVPETVASRVHFLHGNGHANGTRGRREESDEWGTTNT